MEKRVQRTKVPAGYVAMNIYIDRDVRGALRAAASLERKTMPEKLNAILRADPTIRQLLKRAPKPETVPA